MIGIVLAAGHAGQRPGSEQEPRWLVKAGGEALLAQQVQLLSEHNISPIRVITGWQGDKVVEALREWRGAARVETIRNPQYSACGSGYSLFLGLSARAGRDRRALVMNAHLPCDAAMFRSIIAPGTGNFVLLTNPQPLLRRSAGRRQGRASLQTGSAKDSAKVGAFGTKDRVITFSRNGNKSGRPLGDMVGMVRLAYPAIRGALALMQRRIQRGDLGFEWEDVLNEVMRWYRFRPIMVPCLDKAEGPAE